MERTNSEQVPKKFSHYRLLLDQARIDQDVLSYAYEGSGTAEDPYIVTWIPGDAGNPFNWGSGYRWAISMTVAISCFSTAFASSAFSGALREFRVDLHVSNELITAGISLFVLGFAVGPLLWAPLSEMYGRQVVYAGTFAAFTAFNAGCAGAQNIGTLLVLRFFAGAFGSSPMTNAGGVIADIFPASQRGVAMAFFALAPSMGPTLGPFTAGFLSENEGWRWVMGLIAIFSGVLWIIGTLLVPETYAPVLLRKRAVALTKRTGKIYMTKVDIERGPIHILQILQTALFRPWILLFLEPIVLLLSIYIAIVYGTLYLLFGAYPIVFQLHRGWSEGIGGLPFLGVAIGMMAAIVFAGALDKHFKKGHPAGNPPPEHRLILGMVGSIPIPAGMFWFAWTNYSSIHWMSSVAAGVPFGFGLVLIFLSVTNYLIDAYTIFAASVLAANTVLRSLFGAAFPLFTEQMYTNLGIHWASSVPAFLSLACVPFPFVLYKYGAAIRRRCIYAHKAEQAMIELRSKAAQAQSTDSPARGSSIDTTTAEKDAQVDLQSQPRGVSDPQALLHTTHRSESIKDSSPYHASPYDIDRVNTNTSAAGVELAKPKAAT